jgi:hypothetical protein
MNTTMALSRLHHIVRELLEGRLESTSIELLDEFVEIVRFYESGDDSVRASIRAAIDQSESSAFLSLSTVCVVAAVSRCRTDLIDGAVVAHSIEDFRLDPRDNLRVLAIVWYGAERLGVDPTQILRRVAETTTTPSGKHGFLVMTTPQAVTAQAKIVDSVTLDPATPPLDASVTSAFSPFLVRVEPISFVRSAGATGATADLALASAAGGGTTTALSRFALSNPGSTTATVELSAVNASGGSPTEPVVITLPANAQFFTEDLVTAMGLPPLFLGSLIVQSDMPVLVYNQRRSGDTGDVIPVYPQ